MTANATRQQFQITFKHSDQHDQWEPWTEFEFSIEFNARYCTEGDGRKTVKVELDIFSYEVLSVVAWCGKSGADVPFDSDYWLEVGCWIRRKLEDKTDGLREAVEEKCRRHFGDAGE